jgi:peptide/nickel transport system substrate-binding protein
LAPVSPVTAATAEQVKRGGTLTHAINWTVPSMDPHISTLPQHALNENVYEGLVRLRADPKTWAQSVAGVLAESWRSPDAKTIVFKLRQGVQFHDGSSFDAQVASWNFLRARDHAKSMIKATLRVIDTVRALDKQTLEIKTKDDNAALIRVLAHVNGGLVRMVSKAAFDKNGEEWLQRNPVGTGPFKFRRWITDDRVILDRNPDYWEAGADGKALPYLEGLVLRYIPDPTVSLVDMRAGAVHLIEGMALKDIATLRADPSLAYVELPWAGQIYFMMGFNTGTSPFNDVRVRQAALYGIDRVGMHKTLGFGVGAPQYYGNWFPSVLGYDEGVLKYEYNPDKVRQLLREAGYPDGVSIELKVIAREPENTIGEFVQQMWTGVGIKTKLVSQERLSWIDAVRAKNFQTCFWRGSSIAAVDPDLLRTVVKCGGPDNWSQFCDPEIDRLMDQGGGTTDAKKRQEIYRTVLSLIQERAYVGSGFLAPVVSGYRNEVQGLDFNFATPNLRAAWLR